MAGRRRAPVESAYQRRIRRYLEQHPGATRQQARGHRLPPQFRSEYAKRTAGARSAEERRERAGHSGLGRLERIAGAPDRVQLILRVVSERADDGRPTRIDLLVVLETGRTARVVLRPPRRLAGFVARLRRIRDRFPKRSQPWKTIDYVIRMLSGA